MIRPATLALGLVLAATTLGCISYQRGELALAGPTVPPIPMQTVAASVEGHSCGGFEERAYQVAVQAALLQAPGANALVDVRYRFERFCIVVRGRAVRVGEPSPPPPIQMHPREPAEASP